MATTDEQTMTDPETGYADASIKRVTAGNAIEYAYRELGEGDVPLVLLQHFRGNLDNWDPALIDDLALERRVVPFDNVGVGATTGTTPNTVEAMAHDAIAFMDAMSFQRVDLLGFSIGSFVAQEIALIRPDLLRRVVHLDFGDDRPHRRVPSGKVDASELSHEAATSITADDLSSTQRVAVGKVNVDAIVVLRQIRHLAPVLDHYADLSRPPREDALGVFLPKRKVIWMTSGEVAQVKRDAREGGHLHRLALCEKALGDPALIQHLDRACVQPARPRTATLDLGA
jgi:pimeloyl-ACP methyl ester carboxylesterase